MYEAKDNDVGINAMTAEAGRHAKEKGFHAATANVGELLMLIVSEASEALEAYRDGNSPINGQSMPLSEMYYEATNYGDKPCGFPSEIADIVIRCGDLCSRLGIDLAEAVRKKQAYNRLRPAMHGGKKV